MSNYLGDLQLQSECVCVYVSVYVYVCECVFMEEFFSLQPSRTPASSQDVGCVKEYLF